MPCIYIPWCWLYRYSHNETAHLRSHTILRRKNCTSNVSISTEISVNFPPAEPIWTWTYSIQAHSVVLIQNWREKNRHRKTRKSPRRNTIAFCFDFSQQKNQYRNPCYTRTTKIFTATDVQSENTVCNKIIIKVRKMYGSTKSRHQRTDLKMSSNFDARSCNEKKKTTNNIA